jgi:hypothetical protein
MSSRSLMHRVFSPSKPPDGGYPPSFRLVVVGTQLRGSWYLSADEIARAAHGRPPTLRPSARPCLTSLGIGGGLLAAASALRSALPLFGPPEQKSSSSPLLERATARRSSVFCRSAGPPIEWGCSYLWRWNRSSVCNGTLNASVFVHCGCRGLNMYVFSARSHVFSSFSSTKTRLLVVRTASPSVSRPV